MHASGVEIYTIGHSNRTFEQLLALLKEFQIEAVADVRRFPSSRKFPHFNRENLEAGLRHAGVGYTWLEQLGGRRHGSRSEKSPNTGLESAGFRNYADYMLTDAFADAADVLLELARRRRTAYMCAERFFWKCHRRLLSDYLAARGHNVKHILGPGEVRDHAITVGCDVREDGRLVYK